MKTNLYILLFFFSFNMYAQDSAFSQYFMSKMNLNPAYVASEIGGNFSLQHREQWNGIHPFRFSQLSFNTTFGYCGQSKNNRKGTDMSYGLGVLGTFGTQGLVPLNTLQLGFVGGVVFSSKSTNSTFRFLSFGFKVRHNNLSLNANDWVFSGQLDPVYGYDATLLPGAPIPENLRKTYWDTGIGGVGSFRILEGHFNIGVSLDNIRSRDNLLNENQDALRPQRITAHTYIYQPFIVENQFIILNGKFEKQGQLQSFSFGGYWIYDPSETRLFVGVQYRDRNWVDFNVHTNAIVGILGTQFKIYDNSHHISISYDFQTSGLAGSGSLGTLELSYVFSFGKGLFGCKGRGPDTRCPDNGNR